MANVFKLKKGLTIELSGRATSQVTVDTCTKGAVYGLVPDAFVGVKPKVVVKEGDMVKAGDALFVDKNHTEVKFVSPVSGTVKAVARGERRKVLSVQVEADGQQTCAQFSVYDPLKASAEQVRQTLLDSGMFAFFMQRPYAVTACPTDAPKGIFVSAFSDMPLAADVNVALEGNEKDFQTGIDALSRLAKVYLGVCPTSSIALRSSNNCVVTMFEGKCPAGNVGVQINHVAPVNKGEVAWTIGAEEVMFIGRLFRTGKVDLTRTIAVAGSEMIEPSYVKTLVGRKIGDIVSGRLQDRVKTRLIDGNPLTGAKVSEDDFLGAHTTEVTAIPEGDTADEAFGWIMPRFSQFSTSRTYCSWLQGKKQYVLDARVKGGERHMIMSGEYDAVFPMDIYPEQLVKAIIAGDIDRMEALGIYEVAPEDFAVAEFVDSSKLELQRIVREGLDMLRKENA